MSLLNSISTAGLFNSVSNFGNTIRSASDSVVDGETSENKGQSNAQSEMFQKASDGIQGKSMNDTLEKMERDSKNAYVSGYMNSVTTMISALQQNKISF